MVNQPSSPVWPTFSLDMCDRLNEERCLVVAAPSDVLTAQVASIVDEVIGKEDAAAPDSLPSLAELRPLLRVRFTSPEHIAMLQGCIAVHGRCPMLALVDMRTDEDGHAYVLDLPLGGKSTRSAAEDERCGAVSASSSASEGGASATHGLSSSSTADSPLPVAASAEAADGGDGNALRAVVAAFLRRVVAAEEPRAQQGAPPPPGDLVEPRHGVVLAEGRSAVTSTWQRLLHSAVETEGGGALVVFWSDRCPCCPGVLMLLDALVWGMRRLATAMHAQCCVTKGTDPVELVLFPYLVCNIDENDYPHADWPTRCCPEGRNGAASAAAADGEHQRVPTIACYSHSGRLVRHVFKQSRTATNLVRFLLDTCVGPASVSFCFHHRFTQAAMAMAAALDTDALMDVFDESSARFQRAVAAQQSLRAGDSAAVVAAVTQELRSIVHAHLHERSAARPQGTSVEAAVDSVLANLEECPIFAEAPAEEGSAARRADCCCPVDRAVRSANASPAPFGAMGNGAAVDRKRQREEGGDGLGEDARADGAVLGS